MVSTSAATDAIDAIHDSIDSFIDAFVEAYEVGLVDDNQSESDICVSSVHTSDLSDFEPLQDSSDSDSDSVEEWSDIAMDHRIEEFSV